MFKKSYVFSEHYRIIVCKLLPLFHIKYAPVHVKSLDFRLFYGL